MAQHHITVAELASSVVETTSDKITTAVVAGSMLAPWFMTDLQQVSAVAALLAPIFGCIWIVMQIVFKLMELNDKSEDE
jgi:hypothetical protein